MGIDLDEDIFRAYDIRGIVTDNLTEEVVYWVGRAFAAEALSKNATRVAVGRDGRHSSPLLRDALARGLMEGGADVVDVGEVPTPLLYYANFALDTGTGIMITGSHNPPEYNGLKMVIAGETLAEDRIQDLKRRLLEHDLSEGEGEMEEVELIDHYVDRVLDDVAIAQPLKVVVDCGNGVAGAVAPRLLRELGCEVIELYCEVDGDFPNHHPDPADPKNLDDLITVVGAENADLGLAFDGDGDRVGVITNRGQIVWPDKLMMLFARDIVGRNPGADIIYDVKCSRHLNALISEYGGRPIMWKTGHSHIKAKIKQTGALLGGEFSGHICFAERWYGFDDALYSAARLLEILGAESQDADSLFAEFPVTFTTPEIKIYTTESAKFTFMKQLGEQADWGDGTITSIDGIRVDYPDGWGLIRPSNTSPVLTLRFEADGESALDRIKDVFRTQLAAVDPAMTFDD
ncbi:MAG: phosphomannomutase/phosphoglucomutase [Pseudomonadaceae bacterium]|nr:phosphomannomutase/phosphoglucomutase [Pseudomonadaceae bacterium]